MRLLLEKRGITTAEEADRFLNPDYERDLHDPFLILNMDRAVKRILKAIKKKEKIVIYGDYDCDGIPGSVILHDFFKKIGYEHFSNYIPHRYLEGYGLNIPAIEQFAKDGIGLVITVDSGVTDVEPVARANELDIDVIVTDHHLPQEVLPPAYAIINSKQKGDTYPFPLLAGSGVAFKLVQALLLKGKFNVPKGWEKWLLDVAGIATVADMVPLHGENRALAHFGLKVLRRTPRPGLLSLYKKARINAAQMTEDDIGFSIGPRINAASRMGEPIEGFKLLSTCDEVEAVALAKYLENKNKERKETVADMVLEVDLLVNALPDVPVVVVGSPLWRPGVVGLAASRIVERYGKTAFVWGGEGSKDLKGSCRSDGKVNIVALMANAEPGTFLDFGGHELAGGFSLVREGALTLQERLSHAHGRTAPRDSIEKKYAIDQDLSLADVTWDTYRQIERLAPFGVGNQKPLFRFSGIEVGEAKRFGKAQEHFELPLAAPIGKLKAIQFFAPHYKIETGDQISFVAHIEKDTFTSYPTLRLRIVDIV